MYPEYTGVIVQDVFHHALSAKTANATYLLAKQLEAKKGFSVLKPTPFYDTDVVAVTNATAQKYGLKSIGDLKKVGSFKLGGFPECKTRNTCFLGYTKQYGLTNASFLPLAGISAYAALDAGNVLAADVFSTDPPLGKGSKYTVLSDPKHVTGFQNVAPIVKTSVATALGSKFTNTVNAVSATLTQNAIVAMNKAVEVDKQSRSKGREGLPEGEPSRLSCRSSFSVEGRPASISSAPSAGSTERRKPNISAVPNGVPSCSNRISSPATSISRPVCEHDEREPGPRLAHGSRSPVRRAAPSEPISSRAARPANHDDTSRVALWCAMLWPSSL